MKHPMIETHELNVDHMCAKYLITNALVFFFLQSKRRTVVEKQNKEAQLEICAKLYFMKLTSFALSVSSTWFGDFQIKFFRFSL